MEEKTEFPSLGDIVVVKITKVLPYGVFAELLEYNSLKGFVHVSQVASRWAKNIRNFAKENQIRAAQVLSINRERNQIDLSLIKVSEGVQRAKIDGWKQYKRAQKLVEMIALEKKIPFEKAWNEISEPLLQEFDSVTEAFQQISLLGQVPESIPAAWRKPLLEMIKKSIVVPQRSLKGSIFLTSSASNGVELIKNALAEAKKVASKNASAEVHYSGSGKYMVKVVSHDYKIAEKALKEFAESAIKSIDSSGGTGKFEKIEE